jgi:ABC-type antimicrobial peptide transport system permease subunit
MFFTYIYRELRRRHRQALLTALGLAVGVGLVVAVTAYAGGVSKAQGQVLHSLYGVGTDITVTQTAKLGQGGPQRFKMNPGSKRKQGKAFSRDAVTSSPGQQSLAATKVTQIASLNGVKQAVGGLTLTSMKVSGKFAKASSASGVASSAGGSGLQSSSQPAPSASQAPIKVSSYSIAGVDVSQTSLGPLSSTELVSGRTFKSSETTAKVAVLSQSYAKQNKYAVGSTFKISGSKYTVIGLVTSSAGSSSGSNAYIPLQMAQKLSDNSGKVNQVYVKATSANDIAKVKSEIKTVMPKATVTTAQDLASQVSGSLKSASQLADTLGKWLAIAALIAAFAVASLLSVSAVSRRVREFGTLKALGWKSRRIVGQVMGESVVEGVIGGIIGVIIGVIGAGLIAHFSPVLKATVGQTSSAGAGAAGGGFPGAASALGQAAQTVTLHLTAPVSLQLVLLAVGLALAGGVLAGAFGGWRASRLRPADALRRVD